MVALDWTAGDSAFGWVGLELVSVIINDSLDVQSELGVIGDTSTALSESVVGASSSLSRGRGIKMLLRVQICGLPWSFIKAASLYVMGNLGCSCLVDCIEQALQSESVSALSLESSRFKLLEHWEINVAVDRLGGLTVLVSIGVVLVLDCTL